MSDRHGRILIALHRARLPALRAGFAVPCAPVTAGWCRVSR